MNALLVPCPVCHSPAAMFCRVVIEGKVAYTGRVHQKRQLTTMELYDYIFDRDGLCVYCGDYADQVDHVLPRYHDGPTIKGNLVAACHGCNFRKSSTLDIDLLTIAFKHLLAVGEDISWLDKIKEPINTVLTERITRTPAPRIVIVRPSKVRKKKEKIQKLCKMCNRLITSARKQFCTQKCYSNWRKQEPTKCKCKSCRWIRATTFNQVPKHR